MSGILKLVSAIACLVIISTQLMVFGTAAQISGSIAEVERAGQPNRAFARGIEVSGIEDGSGFKPGYVALTNFGKLHDARTVHADFHVPLKDMLEEGESPPDDDMLAAFATARAARLADAECAALKRTLASRCTVEYASGSPGDHGLVYVTVYLKFVQKSAFGAIKAQDRASYVEIQERLTGEKPKAVSFSQAAALRVSLYDRAVGFCDRLRVSEGNCAITSVSISSSTSESGASQRVSATATFSAVEPL